MNGSESKVISHRITAIDYTHINTVAVLRYSTTEEPGIKIKFVLFVAENGIRHDVGIRKYIRV